jgi:YD repeat-containing protein
MYVYRSGRLLDATDPAGRVTRTLYDKLGRRTFAVENDTNFDAPSAGIGGGTTYHTDGTVNTRTDQRGTAILFAYDMLRRRKRSR